MDWSGSAVGECRDVMTDMIDMIGIVRSIVRSARFCGYCFCGDLVFIGFGLSWVAREKG